MKAKVLETGKIVEAKYFKDLTEEEVNASTHLPDEWDDNDIFVAPCEDEQITWSYMAGYEVELIEELK